VRIIAGTYTPDQPPFLNSQDDRGVVFGLLSADGCYKIRNGYAPLAQFSSLQNGSLGSSPFGGGAYRPSGSPYIFVGTATNIYTYSASGFTSIQGGLTTTAGNGLRFCPYGSFMMATNGSDPIKKFDPTTPTVMTTLAAGAPTARYLAVVRGILMAAYAAGNAQRVQWSDTGNPATWTTGGSSLAGTQDMATGGDITGLVGGEYALVLQESRITRWSFTGDTTIWQVDEILTDIGCPLPKSLATVGKVSFFWSNRGFMAFDGTTAEPIGTEKIDRTFQALLDRNYMDNISAVIDPLRSLYIVSVPSSNPPTSVLLYNYVEKAWTTAPVTTPLMFSALSLSVPLESLDALYGNLDAMPVSLDSSALRGGFPAMFLFDGSNMLGQLSGTPMQATFKDGMKELVQGRRSRIRYVRPLTNASAVTVTIGGANSLDATPSETSYSARQGNGTFRTRENWNFTQTKHVIAAGASWGYFLGCDMGAADGGRP
jgi:hypothetical protein